ncbi:MFS transporter [Nocardia arthritidis]|uniref:MFS transporter n=1 Tax=Nocardia arthritidis TaxID=228602 RepID=A0A6G9YMR4_9NOCA|nr:MFS transporter [Nocardia arthritidis]QIS14213.1 MFS transporter [Nocardia arthritidis]
MLRTTRIAVLLLFAAWTVDYVDRIVINYALAPIGHDLRLNHAQQGLVVSMFFLAYAAMQLPGGLLADRYGALTMGTIGLIGWSIFTGLTALAWSFSALLAMRFLFGLVQGVFPAAAYKAIAERSVPEQRTSASGWINSANAVGMLLAAVIAGTVLPAWGWRAMFAVISTLGLLMTLAWRRWMPQPLPHNDIGAAQRPSDHRAARSIRRSPALIGFALMYFGFNALMWGLSAWIPTYLSEERGLTLSRIALTVLPSTALGAVGVVVGARLSDRLGGRPRLIVVPAMTVVAALLFVLPRTGSTVVFGVVAAALTAVAGLCYMPAFSVVLRALPSTLIGSASAVILFGGQLAGVVAPAVFGVIIDRASYTTAFEALVIAALMTVIAAVCVPQTARAFRAAVPAPEETFHRGPGDELAGSLDQEFR